MHIDDLSVAHDDHGRPRDRGVAHLSIEPGVQLGDRCRAGRACAAGRWHQCLDGDEEEDSDGGDRLGQSSDRASLRRSRTGHFAVRFDPRARGASGQESATTMDERRYRS